MPLSSLASYLPRLLGLLALLAWLVLAGGCAATIGQGAGQRLAGAVLNSEDPDSIRQALPSYLLAMDALLQDSDSAALYRSAAAMNSSYASQFAVTAGQKRRLADKAWRYAQKAACLEEETWCSVATLSHGELVLLLALCDEDDLPLLFNVGSVWATWIESNSDDWNAIAKLGQVQLLMERVVQLDDSYEQGNAHLYLGVIATLIPPALGGKAEVGQQHFERAIEISRHKNLMAQVLYAERYARLVFDRELHDRLLQEVLASDPEAEGFTLSNTLAQDKARLLLDSAEQYF